MFGYRIVRKRTELSDLTDALQSLRREVAQLRVKREAEREALQHEETIASLRTDISNLKIDKSRIEESNARERRELEHMIGLERKRQEHDVQAATRDAKLSVREEALVAQRVQFDAQMKFREEQFDTQIDYLKSLMAQILDRLPNIDVAVKR